MDLILYITLKMEGIIISSSFFPLSFFPLILSYLSFINILVIHVTLEVKPIQQHYHPVSLVSLYLSRNLLNYVQEYFLGIFILRESIDSNNRMWELRVESWEKRSERNDKREMITQFIVPRGVQYYVFLILLHQVIVLL